MLAPILEFFQHGIGRVIASFLEIIYQLAYPSNAPAASLTPTDPSGLAPAAPTPTA